MQRIEWQDYKSGGVLAIEMVTYQKNKDLYMCKHGKHDENVW